MDKQGKKTGGRQKGTPNKLTKKVRETITDIVSNYFSSDKVESDIELLKPKERVEVMEKLAAYCIPKLQSVDLDADIDAKASVVSARLKTMSDREDAD